MINNVHISNDIKSEKKITNKDNSNIRFYNTSEINLTCGRRSQYNNKSIFFEYSKYDIYIF